VKDLSVVYHTERAKIKAVDSVSLKVRGEEFVAIVGESGSGKSTLALAIIGLLPPKTGVSGTLIYKGGNLLSQQKNDWRKVRGSEIGMIFQEPLSSLNPITKVGEQMSEALMAQNGSAEVNVYDYSPGKLQTEKSLRTFGLLRRRIPPEIRSEIIRWLKLVRIPDPESILEKYPFELSGGMIQRVMIAMVLSRNPSLLLADEPTTALDVTTQAQILKLMLNLREVSSAAVILVTHDLAVAAHVADRIVMMYAGEVVEDGSTSQVFSNPLHPYTRSLIKCFPRGHKTQGELGIIVGTVPDLRHELKGCKFADRCELVEDRCRPEKIQYVEAEQGHFVRCTQYY
jgi:oligopeptide/dipeptide ABC transporter ATP-binding protein